MFHYHKFTGICELKVAAKGQSSNDSNVLTGPPSCFGNMFPVNIYWVPISCALKFIFCAPKIN
jgi:hypothetical protein